MLPVSITNNQLEMKTGIGNIPTLATITMGKVHSTVRLGLPTLTKPDEAHSPVRQRLQEKKNSFFFVSKFRGIVEIWRRMVYTLCVVFEGVVSA